MNRIEHIVEPQRLLLAWQAPEGSKIRARHIVAVLGRSASGATLRYLKDTDDFRKATELGFQGHPAFKLEGDKLYESGVLETFLRRIPPRTRGDFDVYIGALRLPGDRSQFSDFALLGYSGAVLPGDGFSLIHPFDRVDGPCELLLEVAGFRYQNVPIDDIRVGAEATFEPEPENQHDLNAVRIVVEGRKIGFVNRGQTDAFHYWLKHQRQIHAVVERTNGRPDRPLVYLFVRVEAACGA